MTEEKHHYPRGCSDKEKALLRLLSSEGKGLGTCWSSNQRLLILGNTRNDLGSFKKVFSKIRC
ncbi:hypothetical protein IGI04_015415 [Brassica rapa subsp. trilocularis]|uniref:Uncharacterized protein n=1 Tax=Brassica rapa subsp. trilocularis TaxID=1813537 RepID=A0ABQ7MPZ5_BRACM|nr:hypothetical protein IGI04_015415 [Brassica rapa subsp. trilocularis]